MHNTKNWGFLFFNAIRAEMASFGGFKGLSASHAELNRPTRSGSASRAFGAQGGYPRRHAEFSSASRAFGAQGGRSMVEMLGVLAVIGVLSIGGIAGYRTAMDMHTANEIIDDVNLRATMAAADITVNGAKALNEVYETDLGNTNTLGQTVDIISNGDGTFDVQVNGITSGVCKQIINKDWNIPMYIGETEAISPDHCTGNDIQMAFEFADDLGDTTITAGSGNDTIITPTFDKSTYQACESDTECGGGICSYGRCISQEETCSDTTFWPINTECGDGKYCIGNKCVKKDCETHDDCSADTDNPYCQKFQKEDSASAETYSMCVECTQNAHCGDGYFCGGGTGSCYQSSVNRCYRLQLQQTPTGEDSFTTGGNTYYLSKNKMPWWDAENFCAALGKSLVPANILNTKADGSTSYDDGTYKTALVGELYTGFGYGNYVWTATDYGPSHSSYKTCSVYKVALSYGDLGYNSRDDGNSFRALCWDGTAADIPGLAIPVPQPETTTAAPETNTAPETTTR